MGVLLYSLVAGTMPFKSSSMKGLRQLILECRFKVPPEVSVDCRDLIEKMIRLDPRERISLDDMLSHSWLSGVTGDTVYNGRMDCVN